MTRSTRDQTHVDRMISWWENNITIFDKIVSRWSIIDETDLCKQSSSFPSSSPPPPHPFSIWSQSEETLCFSKRPENFKAARKLDQFPAADASHKVSLHQLCVTICVKQQGGSESSGAGAQAAEAVWCHLEAILAAERGRRWGSVDHERRAAHMRGKLAQVKRRKETGVGSTLADSLHSRECRALLLLLWSFNSTVGHQHHQCLNN